MNSGALANMKLRQNSEQLLTRLLSSSLYQMPSHSVTLARICALLAYPYPTHYLEAHTLR